MRRHGRDVTTLDRNCRRERVRIRSPRGGKRVLCCTDVVWQAARPRRSRGRRIRSVHTVLVVKRRHERVHRLGGLARVGRRQESCHGRGGIGVHPLLLTLRREDGRGLQVLRGCLGGRQLESRGRSLITVVEGKRNPGDLLLRSRRLHALRRYGLCPGLGRRHHWGLV
ncbi:hypothetical protein BD310DRAFT_176998 [Dichomitus squalens]|uniref:Uncharacterized protein n=1 Tax=Dichomitus squalens TaxID=114155 RepID=A0A4Q9Q349_9APHY|nr:hypothetical protein BD310DRAFT_176998 [Dichomitus squalens]